MAKKKEKVEVIDINRDTEFVEDSNIVIDKKAIEVTEKLIEDKKKEMKDKVYSVKMTDPLLIELDSFITHHVEWNNKEALGVIEVNKTLEKVKKKGISNGFIYMEALPLQATHYFVSKTKGVGLKAAKKHMELLKVLDEGLERSTEDAKLLKSLQNELAGLQQGISTE